MGRIIFILGFLGLLNVYVGWRLTSLWPWAGQHALIIWLCLFAFFLLQLAGPFGERTVFPIWRKEYGLDSLVAVLAWLSYLAFGILSLFVVYGLTSDVIRIAWKLISMPEDEVNFDRRAIFTLGFATAVTTIVGVWQAAKSPTVHEVEIPLRNLPKSFDGFKIVQISDLHVGPTIRRPYVENVVAIANGLKPDLIALTGDFIDGTVDDLKDDLAPLSSLQAPQGKFYITGNHEYYWDADSWIAHFKTLDTHVLTNRHEIVTKDGGQIILAGVNDYSTIGMGSPDACNPEKSLAGAPPDLAKILLAHQPITYDLAQKAGFDLQLSGHTHAGQYFPFNLLIRFFQRYYKGLNKYENMWIYVNSATGYWGPPLRTGVPTEITLITLRPEKNL